MVSTRARAGLPLLAVYLGSIVLANWLTTTYGLIPVAPWFGLTATAGTFAIGGVIMTRDLLQDAIGRAGIFLAIGLGTLLSFAVASGRIALASGATFLLAESVEYLAYTPMRARVGWGSIRWGGIVSMANGLGILTDTVLFLFLAGFPLTWPVIAGQLVAKAYVTVAVVSGGMVARRGLPVLRNAI